MPTFLRKLALALLALALVCFCSCERHRAAELPAEEEHAKSGAPDAHDRGAHALPNGNEAAAGVHQQQPNDSGADPAASPVGTPAEFFPHTSPSPR